MDDKQENLQAFYPDRKPQESGYLVHSRVPDTQDSAWHSVACKHTASERAGIF